MDFELDGQQQEVVTAVETLLERHAGPERARELTAKAAYDLELEQALGESGFAEVGLAAGPLEAALVVEAVARAAGCVSVAAGVLVAPSVVGKALPGPVALASADPELPIRFGGYARSLLVHDGADARLIELEPGEFEPLASSYGYPLARPTRSLAGRGEALAAGAGERLQSWWRVALAVETLGTMAAALDTTVAYVKQRRQFGRAIGSFQAVQHRLAECRIALEACRWLAYEAAWRGAPEEAAAQAAGHAAETAARIFAETHQLSGAIGYTHDHPLHVWSMRLQALRLEAGGIAGHRRAAARLRWAEGR